MPNGIFWDIGANAGAYTLYAALRHRDATVVAFEPAAVNYFLLTANCEANGFGQRVRCVLAGLGRENAFATLEVSQFSVGNSFSFHGKPDRPFAGRQSAFIWSMDDLIENQAFPCPAYIKIDVPGMTADILAGGARTLRRPDVREVHMEADQSSADGRALIETVERCGLVLTSGARGLDLTFVRPGA